MAKESRESQLDNKIDFESGLKRLQEIVKSLERQDLSLEEAVKLFEEGMKLSNKCMQILEHAERRVKVLIKEQDSGKVTEKDLTDTDLEITP